MDIEFIKKICEKAEGFKVGKHEGSHSMVELPNGKRFVITSNDFSIFINDWIHTYYPLLLQRAIEGANKFHVGGFKITIRDFDIIVQDYITSEIWRIFAVNPDIDQAKESALKYIYEQELKENK